MTEHRAFRRTSAIVALGLISILAGQTAGAATYTWSNSGTTWNTEANWGGTVPGSADIGAFIRNSYTNLPKLTAAAAVGGLWFTGSGALAITGSALTLEGVTINSNSSTGIEMDPGAGALTIAASLALGGSQSWIDNSANALTVAGNIANGGHLLTVAGNGNSTFAGTISGNGGLTQLGGVMTMSSVLTGTQSIGGTTVTVPVSLSTFSGNITVGSGTLLVEAVSFSIGTNGVLGLASSSRTITVNAGGTLDFFVPNVFGQFYATTVPALVINGGVVTNTAPPGIPIPVVNNALNSVTLNGGTLAATTGESNATGGYGAWNLNGSVTSSGNSFISSTDSTYGQVMLSNANKSGLATTFNVQDGTLTVSAPVVDDYRNGGYTGGLNLTGSGMLLLTASNTYAGGTTVGGGTLQLGNVGALGSGGLTANAGMVDLNANLVSIASLGGMAGTIIDNSTSGGTTTLTVNQSAVTSFGGAINNGVSRHVALAMTGTSTLLLNGTSNYTGGTTIANGTLQLGSSSALGSGSLTLGGGVLDLNGNPLSVLSLGGSAGEITDTSASGGTTTLTVVQGGSSTFSGIIADGFGQKLALAQTGTGQLVLTGSNTYSGPTTINGGTLLAGAANTLSPSSAHDVGNYGAAGTLDVTAGAQTVAALTIGSSGTLNLSAQYPLTINGLATFAVGSTIDISGTSAITLPYPIMTYSGLPSGTFTNVIGLPVGDRLSYSVPGVLDIVGTVNAVWAANGASATNLWTDRRNWTEGAPGNVGDTATIGANSTLATIDLDGATPTVSALTFSISSVSYTIMDSTGTGSLTLHGTGSSPASVTVTSGTHTISAALVLATSTDFSPAGGTRLTLSGLIGGSGALALTDAGTLLLSGTNNSYSGGTFVDVGTLVVDSASALPDGASLTVGPDASSIFTPALAGPAISAAPAGVLAVPEPGTLMLLAAGLAVGWGVMRKTERI